MDEAHRPEAGLRAGAAALAQMGRDDAQQDGQHGADRPRFALHLISDWPAQPFGHRADPLAHRQRREDMIDQVRRRLRHTPGVARRARPAPLARKRNENIMPTVRAAGARETVGEDAAFEVTTTFAFHIGRHALRVPVVFPCARKRGLQVPMDDLVENGSRGMATAVRDWPTSR